MAGIETRLKALEDKQAALQTSSDKFTDDYSAKFTDISSKFTTMKNTLTDKLAQLETSLKKSQTDGIDKLKALVQTNKGSISALDTKLTNLMVDKTNIMVNAKVVGCFNLEGVLQDKETFLYEKAVVPLSHADDPERYDQDLGSGWNSFSTRLDDTAWGLCVIDLQKTYRISEMMFCSYGTHMQELEVLKYVGGGTPDFPTNSQAVKNTQNWSKVMSKTKAELPTTWDLKGTVQSKFTRSDEDMDRFNTRYLMTKIKGESIQTVTGCKAFGRAV